MIEGLKPYAEYKDSGQKWLGQVPGHWSMRRLRASITDCANGVWGSDPNGKDDLICVRVADFDRVSHRVSLAKKTLRAIPLSARSRRLLRNGDLLLEKSGGGDLQPVGAVVSYDHDEPAVCSNFVARMPVANGYNSQFVVSLHFTLYASRINVLSIKQTTGIQNLDSKAYLLEVVAFPPPDEQTAIVRFLDHANRKIDGFIRAKRKLIALLREQKQAIIHRAVTRGLHPDVSLKPSGIPWLGDIPKNWEAKRIKYLLREVDNRSTTGLEPLLSMRMHHGLVVFSEHFTRLPQAASLVGFKIVKPRQFVVNRMQAGNGVIFSSCLSITGLVSPDYAVFDPIADVNVDYLGQLFRSPTLRVKFRSESKGLGTGTSGFMRLYNDRFGAIHIPLPPRQEQDSLLKGIEEQSADLNTAIARTEREIALMQEYRTRLTADLVTGKLDVREAAAKLPDLPVDAAAESAPDEPLEVIEAEETEV